MNITHLIGHICTTATGMSISTKPTD